jgi:apolipoprotein D and lipocalin family protein
MTKSSAAHGARRTIAAAPLATLAASLALLTGCASAPPSGLAPVTLARQVDLARFAGTWYVIASIPTVFERGAHNATEQYVLDADGTMDTTFSFRADAFDGPLKTYHSRGYVLDADHAVWGQQYVWPIRADYRISYVADDYSATIITREKRDHVWIMARTPTISEDAYRRLLAMVEREGYDASKVQRVPQASGR